MAASHSTIGVLGGTFDPVHHGHVSIAKSFLNSTYVDSLLVLLTPQPPHKSSRKFAKYSQRLKMLMAAFEPIDNIKVSDLEFTLPKPSYTYQTVRYLKKSCPNTAFYLCLGEDSFINFKKWYNWQGILELCNLLVAERPGVNPKNRDVELLDHTHFVKHEPFDASSSQIRTRIQKGKSIKDFVPKNVLQLIKQYNLYK